MPLERSNDRPGTLRCHVLSTPKQSSSFIAQKMSQKLRKLWQSGWGSPWYHQVAAAACFFSPAGFGRASKEEKFKVVNKK